MVGVGSSVSSGDVNRLVELIGPVGGGGVRAVVLTGAPGAGKSTTLDALGRALLDQGFDTRRVITDDLGRGRPFGVITDLLGLDRIYPPRPDTLDHVLVALETLSTSRPVALCVDDAHRADPDSLDVLGRLSDLVQDLPIVIVLACRTLPQRAALSALIRRPDVVAVEVTGPDAAGIAGPTLFDHVTTDMSIYTDEIFGPVLSVLRVETYDDAIDLINANPYGNGTAIFTNDGGAARRFQNEVEVGMVGVSVPVPVPRTYYSFGGWKNSLFGDTHAHGTEGVHFFTRGKVVTSRWLDPSHGGINLGFPQNV
jgi:hypothetical protein